MSATQERGTVKNALKHMSRWVAGSAALLAGLSMHEFAALIVVAILLVVFAILGRGMIRWIIDSGDRSDRVTRMISAWRGVDARSLAPGPSAAPPPITSHQGRRPPPRSGQTAHVETEATVQPSLCAHDPG
jgi:hypothetical protein